MTFAYSENTGRHLEKESFQYSDESSLTEIPNPLMHEGICLTDVFELLLRMSHKPMPLSQVALFFSPGVSETTHTDTHADMLTAAGTDVAILGCVHTESRLAEEHVFVFHDSGLFFMLAGSKSGRT